jgi:hypothetical protein
MKGERRDTLEKRGTKTGRNVTKLNREKKEVREKERQETTRQK